MDRRPGRSAGMSPAIAPVRELQAAEQLEALYRSCADDLYAYVASLLRDRAAAEDVTALAFERVLRRRSRFDPRRGSERAWLFAIARNAALDEVRRRRRTRSLMDELVSIQVRDAAGDVDAELADRRLAVRAGLERLAAREREVILLKFLGRLSNAELARVLGCSESNAGTRLHRAVSALREVCDAP